MIYRLIALLLACSVSTAFFIRTPSPAGVLFRFKGKEYSLDHKMQSGAQTFGPRTLCNNRCLDTLSNHYLRSRQYVEIIRQDDPVRPRWGIALGFEFDDSNGDYPYTPAFAVIQLKNFGWGGVEFSQRDTFNYTGVSNIVSDDISIEIDSFYNDTICGRFSGLLLSGAGPMAGVDSGTFKVHLYVK